jgi:hypothetical protein
MKLFKLHIFYILKFFWSVASKLLSFQFFCYQNFLIKIILNQSFVKLFLFDGGVV